MNSTTTEPVCKRALLATDDKALPKLLEAVLEPNGFDLQAVSLRGIKNIDPDDYAILVLDGDMQFIIDDGLPIVIVISPSDPIGAYDNGADLVVNKPLVANVLMAKIRAVMRRYGVAI